MIAVPIAIAFGAFFFALFQWRESFFDEAQGVREGQDRPPFAVKPSFHDNLNSNGGQHDHV